MNEIFISIIGSVGLISFVAFLARNWITERLKQGIKHEYDEKLERLRSQLTTQNSLELERSKAELSRQASVLAVAHKSLSESASIVQRNRIDGVSTLWGGMLNVRNHSPSIFTLLDALLAREYQDINQHTFKVFEPDIPVDTIKKMVGEASQTVESVRPFVGEYLWSVFYAYQAIHLRIAFLYTSGREKNIHTPWYHDQTTTNLLKSLLNSNEMAEFEKLEFGHIKWMRQVIESKFLSAADKVFSGQQIADSTKEEAARIAHAADALASPPV